MQVVLSQPGFHTHGQELGQRMVQMSFTNASTASGSTLTVTAPRDASVMQPGVYLIWVVNGGIPSTGGWVKLS